MNKESNQSNESTLDLKDISKLSDKKSTESNVIGTPSIELPKGGGALRGIDEQFNVNAANGTASTNIPLPFSTSRNGFMPPISLAYNSGAGNSSFGLGWSLNFPVIQRKTDKKLPHYHDDLEEDVFTLAGEEDLVPYLVEDGGGNWVKKEKNQGLYEIRRYRPRVESGFSRIERITHSTKGTYWRITTSDNQTTLYGRSESHRIADPEDSQRIYQWLPEFSFDDKGGCYSYEFKAEDLGDVAKSLSEKNRHAGIAKFTNKYLKRIRYGNKTPYYLDPLSPFDPQDPISDEYFFETIFDFGEHDLDIPTPTESLAQVWRYRDDPFSVYKAGFEIRTNRLCQRVLMFHHFKDEVDFGENYLVRSLNLEYTPSSINASGQTEVSYLASFTQFGYIKKDNGSYTHKSFPAIEFSYQELNWNSEIKVVSQESIANTPVGLADNYQWSDLYGEGISGILTEQGDSWFYKENLGDSDEDGELQLGYARKVANRPSFSGLASGALSLRDLEANGQKQIVIENPNINGYFELNRNNDWEPFHQIKNLVNISFNDPNLRRLDLNGDGKAELVISDESAFIWYESTGKLGYKAAQKTVKSIDEELGPKVVFSDQSQRIYLADMSGDGLTDIVRIRNSEICYWPNKGYGHFGAKVTMDNAPVFDKPDLYNPQYLHLADVSGTGASDVVYIGANEFKAYLNLSGNSWSDVHSIDSFFAIDQNSKLSVIDLLGTGTSCIVWSSNLPKHAQMPMQYIDLMGSKKPHVMNFYKNNLGKEITIEYKSSTYYYLKDKQAGRPWITKLPFPVQCVSKVGNVDHVVNRTFSKEYLYHHGYYDYPEKEYRGFGCVEQIDSENFEHFIKNSALNLVDKTLYQSPILTKTWFHTGTFLDNDFLLSQYEKEYFKNEFGGEYLFPNVEMPSGLSTLECRELHRSLKGLAIREEVYALDSSEFETLPYTTVRNHAVVKIIQPRLENKHASFLVVPSEKISYEYERNPEDPRVSHSIILESNEYGETLRSASIVYPRRIIDVGLPEEIKDEQNKIHINVQINEYTNDINIDHIYRLRAACEQMSYEFTGLVPLNGQYFTQNELNAEFDNADSVEFDATPNNTLQKRLYNNSRTFFYADDLTTSLKLGEMASLGIVYEQYKLVFTTDLASNIYNSKLNVVDINTLMTEGGYVHSEKVNVVDAHWWAPSGRSQFPIKAKDHFYLSNGVSDPMGNITSISYDEYDLLIENTTDPVGNLTVAQYDYRTLKVKLVKDPNSNRSAVEFDELAIVVKTAYMGKEGADEGDTLDDPTTRVEYDLNHWVNNNKPNFTHSFSRELHGELDTPWQESFAYSDGSGEIVMVKAQAEPGMAKQVDSLGQVAEVDTGPNIRWIGTGRTIVNNKGNPVKQYEPYFSVSSEFEDNAVVVELGVTNLMYYDPLGRLVKTESPDKTYSKTEFSPWQKINWDPNDTILEPGNGWYIDRGSPDPNGPEPGSLDVRAAWLASKHSGTPYREYLDSLGRPICFVEDNASIGKYLTITTLDIEGNKLAVRDARLNSVVENIYSMSGVKCIRNSMDSGSEYEFFNVSGKQIRNWDSRENIFRSNYDGLNRPREVWVKSNLDPEKLIIKNIFGEAAVNAVDRNLRGKKFQSYDQAGFVEKVNFDFRGNLSDTLIRYSTIYKTTFNWDVLDPEVLLETEVFQTHSDYDALGRVIKTITPNSVDVLASEIVPVYNEAGHLKKLVAKLRGSVIESTYIENISYDSKGQRESITYGNGARTLYTYDVNTFRLVRLKTDRTVGANSIQDLNYIYDPVGNIISISDNSQQSIYFNNAVVGSHTTYVYDALYKLIEASGREQVAQNEPISPYDEFRTQNIMPGDGSVMRRYSQSYEYDEVGNILKMLHHAGNGSFQLRWQQNYGYENTSNQLTSTTVGGNTSFYSHDAHGNMSMPHLDAMDWDYNDQLKKVKRGTTNAWYVYDKKGVRVRKVVEKNNKVEDRLYLGDFEIFRKSTNGNVDFARETLHFTDDKVRVALVETKTIDKSTPHFAITILDRYQLNNSLSSCVTELDDNAQLISYEEYYPFGSTSYQAGRTLREVKSKQYRYTGKERDEESGFSYHGARYYALWLGRWNSADPIGIEDGLNVYAYVKNNPIGNVDHTGKWTWGQVAGIAAAVVVGVAVTAATGGLGAPAVIAAIAGGVAGGVTAEVVEAVVDGRETSVERIAVTGIIGGVTGGLFHGGGQLLSAGLRTGLGKALTARVVNSAAGRGVANTFTQASARLASEGARQEAAPLAVRAATVAIRGARGTQAFTEGAERTGEAVRGVFTGTPSRTAIARETAEAGLAQAEAQALAVSESGGRARAAIVGEIDDAAISLSTRSGRSGTGPGSETSRQAIGIGERPIVRNADGIVAQADAPVTAAIPAPDPRLIPFDAPNPYGRITQRTVDAELKLFGQTLLTTDAAQGASSSGTLYLFADRGMCGSCTGNLFNLRAALPAVNIITAPPLPQMSGGASGIVPFFELNFDFNVR